MAHPEFPTTAHPEPPTTADLDPLAARPGAGAFSPVPGRLAGLTAFDPGRRGVKALAAVAAVVVLVAAFLAWRARPDTEPVPPPPPAAAVDTPAAPVTTPAAEVVVAVAGKVRKPGLVRLPPGSRVADAIAAAGGPTPGVDISLLNPARKVVDGELIAVGITPPPGVAAGPAPGGGAPAAGGLVNLNSATQADLETLPGVGPVLAKRILAHRDQKGGFRAVSDLRSVDGIGDSRYEQLKDLVTV
ncbi:helix-hairpin-helix domain-containing protein [Spirilliplanes yamanashiensis]|uniref:helix-hairpin-helix domain-containing protein n=1 Tax=Spirilliplanes yamanashiensis TaxID=42233 RepID=UPI0035216FEC